MNHSVKELVEIARKTRIDIIKTLVNAKSGHTAGPLGMVEVFTVLYYEVLNHKPANPEWNGRDRLILSNGHICPVLYVTLANQGYFPKEELETFRKINSRLQGHPHNLYTPGVENSSGPLGQGISQAVGFALAAKIKGEKHRVYCITSDGEHDEGQTWEAYMFAAEHNLDNLTILIDRNNIQIDGYTKDIMSLEPLKEKLESFNMQVIEVDGHDFIELLDACNTAEKSTKTTVIICHTIPGKGVSFMENDFEWHGKPPVSEDAEKALKELDNG
jgi:transketolase